MVSISSSISSSIGSMPMGSISSHAHSQELMLPKGMEPMLELMLELMLAMTMELMLPWS